MKNSYHYHLTPNFLKFLQLQPTKLFSIIFFFSGFAALIYQVVWQRLLTLHYGVGSISIILIVSVYMVGLGLGALAGGYLAEKVQRRLLLYFIIELLIGIFGLISLPLLDFIGYFTAGSNYLLSLIYIFLFLAIPTFLMGMTLPLLTKMFNSLTKDFLSSVSFLYFINTLGAAIGTLFSSYILISFFGLDFAIYVAVIINFILAIMIFFFKNVTLHGNKKGSHCIDSTNKNSVFGKTAYFLVFITGFLAIGYEIIWFRIIGVLVKSSPYAFSSVLFVYLIGIALGSLWIDKYLKKHQDIHQKSLFFLIQLLLGLGVVIIVSGYYYLTKFTSFGHLTAESFANEVHPWVHISSLSSISDYAVALYNIIDIFWWSAIFALIPAILMGATFPLISLLALSNKGKEAQTVGLTYFFNISGNVFGGFITGFILLPYFSTEMTLLLFSSIGILFAVFITKIKTKTIKFYTRAILTLFLLVISFTIFPKSGQLYEIMHPTSKQAKGTNVYFEEGVEGIILTYQKDNRIRNYINGASHGGRPIDVFSAEALETLNFVSNPTNVLVIGFGTGTSAEVFQNTNGVRHLTLVEINKTLLKNLKKMTIFREILNNPKLNLIYDDGRRFLLRSNKKYDIIAIDPLRNTTAYSNNIYSREFYELIKNHLNINGVFMLWTDEFEVMPNTVNAVFKHVRLYNHMVLASNHPLKEVLWRKNEVRSDFTAKQKKNILSSIKYIGNENYIREHNKKYPINEDWKPINEYYFGLRLKKYLNFYK